MRDALDFSLNNKDMKILYTLKESPKGLLELQRSTGIAYKNFQPHIQKLESYKLITIKKFGQGKKAVVDLTDLAFDVLKLGLVVSGGLTPEQAEKHFKKIKK